VIESKKSIPQGNGRIWQMVFIAWLLLVNFFYYLQFHDLLLARFGAWIHRWR
jgi:hypothetical protein